MPGSIFAIASGHVMQLVHAFSFRHANPSDTLRRIKGWSWTIRDRQERDGRLLRREAQP